MDRQWTRFVLNPNPGSGCLILYSDIPAHRRTFRSSIKPRQRSNHSPPLLPHPTRTFIRRWLSCVPLLTSTPIVTAPITSLPDSNMDISENGNHQKHRCSCGITPDIIQSSEEPMVDQIDVSDTDPGTSPQGNRVVSITAFDQTLIGMCTNPYSPDSLLNRSFRFRIARPTFGHSGTPQSPL